MSILEALGWFTALGAFVYLWCHFDVFERLFGSQLVFKHEDISKAVNETLKEHPDPKVIDDSMAPFANSPMLHPDDEAKVLNFSMSKIVEARMKTLHRKMYEMYPDHIIPPSEIDWSKQKSTGPNFFLCSTGGAIGQVLLLHMSLSEYIMIFGSPLGTTGHSGRYLYNIRDYMISGHHKLYDDGDLHGKSYPPGHCAVLRKGEGVIYKSDPHTYMIEHGRGFPGMLIAVFYPFLATMFSTFDFWTFGKQMVLASRMIMRSLAKGKF